MKKMIERIGRVLLSMILVSWMGTSWAGVNPKPFVVPELTTWTGAEGCLKLSGRVAVKEGGKELMRVAQAFAADYEMLTGKKLKVVKGEGDAGDYCLQLADDAALGQEGYRMEIGEKAMVRAATVQGVYWATRTLLQLAEQQQESLPKGEAVDVPQYAMRGFMMDCGRKFIPMDYLHSLIRIMAYYKMNTLQIHLNDNGFKEFFGNDWDRVPAAFRLESETYPGLAAKDGHYTKREFVDMQMMAEEHFVEVIPEIDVPAHTLAFTHYKPEIGSKEYGMDHLDLFNPETYEFVDGLFKEYLEGKHPVFRGPRVHIGTDEYSNARKDVVEKFREFTDHYLRFVESYGKQAMCWGALTHAKGDTPVKSENVIMSCWYNGYADPKEMKKQGYQLLSVPDGLLYIVPGTGYYHDYLDCEALYRKWTPALIGNQKFEENDPCLLGGMFAVWNDHVGNGITVKDIHHRLMPAMQTLAVKCWTGQKTSLPFKEFDVRRQGLSEAPGVNERAVYGAEKRELLTCEAVTPGMNLPLKEIGYDYSVSFTVEAKEEAKGTELFRSANAVFYLSDPEKGLLGFARDGYLNRFNYRLPVGERVTITIQGNNRMTVLYVDGEKIQELAPVTLYAAKDKDKYRFQLDENLAAPDVYTVPAKMFYHRTLVFPLEKAGRFSSEVSHLRVWNYWRY